MSSGMGFPPPPPRRAPTPLAPCLPVFHPPWMARSAGVPGYCCVPNQTWQRQKRHLCGARAAPADGATWRPPAWGTGCRRLGLPAWTRVAYREWLAMANNAEPHPRGALQPNPRHAVIQLVACPLGTVLSALKGAALMRPGGTATSGGTITLGKVPAQSQLVVAIYVPTCKPQHSVASLHPTHQVESVQGPQ
jgi:hypothetical protein